MYKTSDTPNAVAFPNDALIEFENAAGEQQYVLGSVINALIKATDVTYANLNTNGDVGAGATQVAKGNHAHDTGRVNILSKSANYTILAADLTNYDHLIVLVDASVASRTIKLPAPNTYSGKTIQVIANVDPAGFSVITNKSGGAEYHTGYAKSDFVKVVSDGTNDIILDEAVTVYGYLAKTLDQAYAGATQANGFATNYSVEKNTGGWFDSVTNHRLDLGFDCEIDIVYVPDAPDPILPTPSITGVYIFNSIQYSNIANTWPLQLLSTDYVRFDFKNAHATGTYNLFGNAAKIETHVYWRVIKRIRS